MKTSYSFVTAALNHANGIARAFLNRKIKEQTSAAATAQQLSLAAPGAGKAIRLTTLIARYSAGTDGSVTVTATQGAASKTITVKTGAQLALTGLSIGADENTAITIDAPAGAAGETSYLAAEYIEETL